MNLLVLPSVGLSESVKPNLGAELFAKGLSQAARHDVRIEVGHGATR